MNPSWLVSSASCLIVGRLGMQKYAPPRRYTDAIRRVLEQAPCRWSLHCLTPSIDESCANGVRSNDLELGIEFRGEQVLVAVSGDLDMLTAGILAGVLNAMVDAGHRDLVVNVGGVTFIGAAGVGVFARVSRRLSPMGGTITLRSASEQVHRVFDITG